MNAIILCSGLSSRLYPITKHLPKCLLKIGGITILDRTIDALLSHNIEEIIIVVGHAKEKIIEVYGNRFKIVSNPYYNRYGDFYTVYAVSDYLKDNSLILNGDIVFDKDVFSIFSDQVRPELLLKKKEIYDAEDVLVVQNANSYMLDKNLHNHPCKLGEYIGISKIGRRDLFLNATSKMAKEGNYQSFHEHIFQKISEETKVEVIDIGSMYYHEIDTIDDYNNLNNLWANNEARKEQI